MVENTVVSGTELSCSRIGLGTWAIGGLGWGGTDEATSIATIQAAVDQGITLVDTAPAYGKGTSESFVGKALAAGGRRDKVVLSTKVGVEWSGGDFCRNSSRQRIEQEIAESLRRLRTEVIDIYHIHWPDPLVPIEETAEIMKGLTDSGRIRAIGVSNAACDQLERFRAVAPLHVVQPPYNLFERAIEADILPYARTHGLTTLTYGALCRGLLSGSMTPDTKFKEGELRHAAPKFQPPRFAQYLAAVGKLDALAQERFDRRVIHLALAWLLAQPGVGVALWGARTPKQLAPLGALDAVKLDAATLQEIDEIVRGSVYDPVGPEFMAPPARDQSAA